MSKLALWPALLAAGCVISGVYGAVHDQVSYTISPEYFHRFKFITFPVPAAMHDRRGAAMVGAMATWWMGLIIGVPVLTAGLVTPGAGAYARRCLIAFGVVAATALIVGLVGLGAATAMIDPGHLPEFWYLEGTVDRAAFARVGVMHDCGYLGGFVGILTGSAYLLIARRWRG